MDAREKKNFDEDLYKTLREDTLKKYENCRDAVDAAGIKDPEIRENLRDVFYDLLFVASNSTATMYALEKLVREVLGADETERLIDKLYANHMEDEIMKRIWPFSLVPVYD